MRLGRPLWCLVAVGACASRPAAAGPEPDLCRPPTISVERWRHDSLSTAVLRLPPGTSPKRSAGIDSEVWEWNTPTGTLMADYGAYSGPYQPSPGDQPGQACTAVVRGDTVIVAEFRRSDGSYGIQAWWPRLDSIKLGRLEASASLTLLARARSAGGRDTLRASIYSIQIRHPTK